MQYKYLQHRGALLDDGLATSTLDQAVSGLPDHTRRLISGPSVVGFDSIADLSRRNIPPKLLELIPESVARENGVIPVETDGREIILAAASPNDIALKDKLRFILNADIRLIRAPRNEILAAINRHYGSHDVDSVDSMLCEFTETAIDFEDVRAAREGTLAMRSHSAPRPMLRRAAILSQPQRPRRQAGGRSTMFYYTVEEGQRVLRTDLNGKMSILTGPCRVWKGFSRFEPMTHNVAHPGEFLIVKARDGHEEHRTGPAEIWFDPRIHESITRQECLQISAKEAVVAYRQEHDAARTTTRRIIYGPSMFMPEPGEWLHTFSWHASHGGSQGVKKVPNGLVFQKLWLMPDQMYHDVPDVRTSDDAVLTIRLMIFFELTDIERMLQNTHDPIGDFVNAATADVVEFTGKHDFASFKQNTEKLNDLATYKTLIARSAQSGYRIHNVVYRGYGAADSLQLMHNQAIEARTKLQLERATEEQAQSLENFKLESQMARAEKRRIEQTAETRHLVELAGEKAEADLRLRERQRESQRRQRLADSQTKVEADRVIHAALTEFYNHLRNMGVDLTAYLTQGRADNVIELRGGGGAQPHLHLERRASANGSSAVETDAET